MSSRRSVYRTIETRYNELLQSIFETAHSADTLENDSLDGNINVGWINREDIIVPSEEANNFDSENFSECSDPLNQLLPNNDFNDDTELDDGAENETFFDASDNEFDNPPGNESNLINPELDDDLLNSILNDNDNVFDDSGESESENEDEFNSYFESKLEIIDVGSKLASWATFFHIAINAMNDLLSYFKSYFFPNLPADLRTLQRKYQLKTDTIEQMDSGRYLHFGLKEMLIHFLMKNKIDLNQSPLHFEICCGIDGVPLVHSSLSSFWPILIKLKDYSDVFPVAVYHGNQKPLDIHVYMNKFLEELDVVVNEGLSYNGKLITFSIGHFVFDAAARHYLMDITGYTGYYACPRCVTRGEYINHRLVYPSLNEELRTDKSFKEMQQIEHHRTGIESPLANFNIQCISCVPIDYMHNVLLGVFRALLKFWVLTKSQAYSLSEEQIREIERRIALLRHQTPTDFARIPRKFDEVPRFKATELRLILLYTGPVLFLNVLEKRYYDHFLKLHAAIRILCSKKDCIEKNHIAKNLLYNFICEFKVLYGKELLVYNFHLITHLADECLLHGPLDNFSAFPFENFLQSIKRMVKRAPYPLEQLKNRLGEQLPWSSLNLSPIRFLYDMYNIRDLVLAET